MLHLEHLKQDSCHFKPAASSVPCRVLILSLSFSLHVEHREAHEGVRVGGARDDLAGVLRELAGLEVQLQPVLASLAKEFGFDLTTPWQELGEDNQSVILYGTKGKRVDALEALDLLLAD